MDIYTLVKDDVKVVSLDDIKSPKRTVWIRSINPSKEEIEELSKLADAPIEDFRDFIDEDERPRVIVEKHLQVIYRSPFKGEDEIVTVPITFFINGNIVITVEKQKVSVLDKIEHLILLKKSRFLFKRNSGSLLYYILDKINDEFLHYVDRISDHIDIYEQKQMSLSRENVERIYGTSVTLAFFNQAMLANLEALNSLRKTYYRHITPKNKELFSDLYYDALQIIDTEKIQREVITNLFNMQSIIGSNRLNRLMKRLTSLALIIMVPTLISGIYGMNFKYMPLANWQYGFHITLILMVVFVVLALLYARSLDWL